MAGPRRIILGRARKAPRSGVLRRRL